MFSSLFYISLGTFTFIRFYAVFTISFYHYPRVSCPPCDSQSWAAHHKAAQVVWGLSNVVRRLHTSLLLVHICEVEFNNQFCLSTCQLKILKLISPYCPRQAPIGAHSSTTKNWWWAVSQRRCLNGSTFLMEGPTPNVSCLRTKFLLCPCFVKASPMVEKAVKWTNP